MNVVLRSFCWIVLCFDYLPRYGRLYTYIDEIHKFDEPEWRFQRRGNWGMYFLIRVGLFQRYLDYYGWDD